MRRLRAVLFFAIAWAAACGPSVTDTCDSFATVWCDKHYSCVTGADLAALQAKYGADAATCATAYAALNCSPNPCPPGKSYDTGLEQTCITQYGNLTCTDIQNNTLLQACDVQNTVCH